MPRRKIPVRKHHGIRDPLKQLEEREKKLKNVINKPPTKGDQDKLSFKMTQFQKLVEDVKKGKKIKKLSAGREDKPKEASAATSKKAKAGEGNKFRPIKQFPGEDDEDYLRRVNRITSESLRDAQYEAKYGVKVIRDPKTGEITIKKQPKNEIDELLKQKQKEKRLKGKKGLKKPVAKPIDPKLAKELIKQAIKEDEEEKRKESSKELVEYKRDVIQFGEVVHAPPTLSTLPRKAQKSDTVPRPGQKDNLLLKSLLKPEIEASTAPPKLSTKPTKKGGASSVTKTQLKGKRKDLPKATRSMLESEQGKIIELYRNLKKSKQKEIT